MKKLLEVKASRISSLKSVFFPMKYEFFGNENGQGVSITATTRNWIGQKTTNKLSSGHFRVKGFILRKMTFTAQKNHYGRFWAGSCKKVRKLLEERIPESSRIEWSDAWF